jgi:light-regulated signal transduction histidine kinase (bacteriophytochrome)/ActR/RegA family two-component response regulator
MNAPKLGGADITSCASEPIHIIGAVQPFGFLLVCAMSDWTITHASQNVAEHLGRGTDELVGLPLETVVTRETLHSLRNALQSASLGGSPERRGGLSFRQGGTFDVTIHPSGESVLIEAEPSTAGGNRDMSAVALVKAMSAQLSRADGFQQFCNIAARQIRAVTGFDRVLVYRFLHDGAGKVIAEARNRNVDSFLDLHFPASDIPPQARALYEKSWLRMIPNVEGSPVPILPAQGAGEEPVDLSLSTLRAVSPIHIEYLRNMGVCASLSVSILREGRLWGLFACHHLEPRHVPVDVRVALELFAQLFSLQLEAKERRQEHGYETAARAGHERLLSRMASDASLFDDLEGYAELLFEIIPAEGVGVWANGQFTKCGLAPPGEAIPGLVNMLNALPARTVFSTDKLSDHYPPAAAFASETAGLLAIPIIRSTRDYVLFFRPEVVQSVLWGGDPNKSVQSDGDGARISPRKSFEAWKQEVRHRSQPWTEAERRIAGMLRHSLVEVALRRTDQAERERAAAQERQEVLIAELDHRVKNILALIRAVVAQTRQGARSLEQFTRTLDGRIHALAAAHDQLTEQRFSPAPLAALLESELSPYGGYMDRRVSVAGPDVLLDPHAFTVLALVLHELTTNAAKHGALSQPGGTVHIEWGERDGAFWIDWREEGGPAVHPPARKGFGSTVMERTIPYELRGTSLVQYEPEGLQASFSLPLEYVRLGEARPSRSERVSREASAARGVVSGSVLAVEDNTLIAIDLGDMLGEIGFHTVQTAGSVEDGLRLVEAGQVDAAVLDLNLGRESSVPLALALMEREIPFILATGYGDRVRLPEALADVPRLAKPYGREKLMAAFAKLGLVKRAPRAPAPES